MIGDSSVVRYTECPLEVLTLGARLMQLIEAHAPALTKDVVGDLTTDRKTPNFAALTPAELEKRSTGRGTRPIRPIFGPFPGPSGLLSSAAEAEPLFTC